MNGRVAKTLRHRAYALWLKLGAGGQLNPDVKLRHFYKQLKRYYYLSGRNVDKTRLRYE